MMRKVRGARFGHDEGQNFDENRMHWNYERFTSCRVGEISEIVLDMMKMLEPNRHPTIELILIAACYYDVPYIGNTLYDLQSCNQPDLCVLQRTLNMRS